MESGFKVNKRLLPIGIDSFKELREKEHYFVDKSELICDVLTRKIFLITRPRRFGKTLSLDMMRYFFDNGVSTCDDFESRIKGEITADNKYLFDGLKISDDTEAMKHQGKYPVIFISFKEIKAGKWQDCYEALKSIIRRIYSQNEYVLKYAYEDEKVTYEKVKAGESTKVELEQSLKNIMEYFYRYFKQKAILIIDEYDQPIISGYCNGYYPEVVEVIRNMLSSALKTNDYLEKGILTGVTRVAKESVFSGLNNLYMDSMLLPVNADKFGFTEEEVKEMLKYYGKSENYEDVKLWYNGYKLNNIEIYNPWSVLNYVEDKKSRLISYWVNTGSDDLIRELLKDNIEMVVDNLNKIIKGEPAEKEINEAVNFNSLDKNQDYIWSLMLQSGYLKAGNAEEIGKDPQGNGLIKVNLEMPNRELSGSYESMVNSWLSEKVGKSLVETMLQQLTEGSIEEFIEIFKRIVIESMSTYDATGQEAEKYYHIFCLGLFIKLKDKYHVKSELETGLGRSDVILIPKSNKKRGIIIEFKKAKKVQTIEAAAEVAIQQIEEKKYDVMLKEHEVKEIVKLGIGFKGKDCEILVK
ncbi:MAG TPA: AAA family ATPase [Clostridiales bacterium]|nr:MAG: hypothetical protein A2Y22_08090 [Clostridiales bacterium GWD2_32_59]HAN09202.1 AAA family ATPase [Clostridiales bacterium]